MENYFVLQRKDKNSYEVIGFNLTKEQKDELFYTIDKGDGHRSSPNGRAWGAFDFKCEDEQEFRNYLDARDSFLTTKMEGWRQAAIDLYEELNVAYEQLKLENSDGHLSHIISDISKVIVRVERQHGIHNHDKFL